MSATKHAKRSKRHARRVALRELRAAAGEERCFYAESDDPVELLAQGGDGGDSEDGGSSPRRFRMNVYGGGKMRPDGFPHPVVVELVGLSIMAGRRPILFIHDQKRPVGHSDKVTKDKSLIVEGALSVDNEDSRSIASSSDNGFPWRASVGMRIEKIQFYGAGESFRANGRTFRGPCYYVSKGEAYEFSFVTVAGDNTSSARIAANLAAGEIHMDFEQWLEAKGFDPTAVSDQQREFLQAMYDQENGTESSAAPTQEPAAAPQNVTAAAPSADDAVTALRESASAELRRHSEIGRLCAQYGNPTISVDGQDVNLQAHAVEHGWDATQTELQALRASRSQAPAAHTGRQDPATDQDVLEAAACLSLGTLNHEQLLATFGEQTLNRADPLRNIGLRELTAMACRAEGIHVPPVWGDGRETLRAAFTTQTLPAVFESVMNKSLLPIFEAITIYAMSLCRIARVSDFKQISRVRLLGSGKWEKVGADGELKHGTVSDEKFTNRAETFGQYLMLTRQDWINDDLGALDDLARYMAIMGSQVVDDEFFTLFLANTGNFFGAGNGNVGAGAAFGPSGLSALKTVFRKIKAGPGSKAKDKRPINITPTKLLVPVELEDAAFSLIGSANLIQENQDTTATAPSLTAPKNPHQGRYEVMAAPQLSDELYTGHSETAYTLFSDPNIVAAFELAFLNGVSRPTIERVEAPSNALGMGFRGYIDFGLSQQDPRGAAQDAGGP